MINHSTKNIISHQKQHQRRLLVISILSASLLFTIVVGTILAQGDVTNPANLSTSRFLASKSEAVPGDMIDYRILIENSGGVPADVVLTDTLPVGLTFVPESVSISEDRGAYQQDNRILTWTDTVMENEQLEIGFSALVSDTILVGSELSNTVEISGAGTILTMSVPTTVVTQTSLFFPLMRTPLPVPILNLQNPPNSNNQWTISWSSVQLEGSFQYEVQEDTNPDFTNPQVELKDSLTNEMNFNKSVTWRNLFFYRVRVITSSLVGPWSNTIYVAGNYADNFDDPNSGWTMRREDTDTTNNSTYYDDGHFVHRMKSGWDSLLGGPLMPAPQPPYRIESKIQLVGKDNLHTYGLVFGGDWDGSQCPNSDFTSCYNQYYRLLVTWYGNNDELKYQLKRIDSHDPDNGHARGSTLIGFREVQVKEPSHKWQVWGIEVQPDGVIKIFVNGNKVGQITDSSLIENPYFGTYSAVDEYTGLQAEFDWYKVTSLTP